MLYIYRVRKGSIRLTDSNSWPCTVLPRSHTKCLRAFSECFLSSLRLVEWSLPWRTHSCAQPSLSVNYVKVLTLKIFRTVSFATKPWAFEKKNCLFVIHFKNPWMYVYSCIKNHRIIKVQKDVLGHQVQLSKKA